MLALLTRLCVIRQAAWRVALHPAHDDSTATAIGPFSAAPHLLWGYRPVPTQWLLACFKNGFFYNKEKISDKEIMNNLKKEKSEYYRRYDKWIKLLFQTYNLKLNNFKKKDNFFYFQNKKSEFYILNLDNLNNFIKSFTKTFVKKKVIRKDSNIAKNKAYSKTYQRIKKKSNFLKKFNNHNFVYLKKIHKKLNM